VQQAICICQQIVHSWSPGLHAQSCSAACILLGNTHCPGSGHLLPGYRIVIKSGYIEGGWSAFTKLPSPQAAQSPQSLCKRHAYVRACVRAGVAGHQVCTVYCMLVASSHVCTLACIPTRNRTLQHAAGVFTSVRLLQKQQQHAAAARVVATRLVVVLRAGFVCMCVAA
jgi:hypothetical protein